MLFWNNFFPGIQGQVLTKLLSVGNEIPSRRKICVSVFHLPATTTVLLNVLFWN